MAAREFRGFKHPLNFLKSFALSLLLSIPCFATTQNIVVNQFSGLDTQDPPSALQPNQSQDLLNVRLQPGGRSVYKRDGYGLFQTLNLVSTATIHGGYHFQQVSGSDVQLWGSDAGLYSIVSDGTPVLVATATTNSTWQCTDNLGFAYCVTNTGIDTPVKTDGTKVNTTYVGTIPAGTIVASTPLQLVVAGVSGNASSVYVSSNNAFANFGQGPLPTDPYIEIINAPGSRITHLAYYFGNIYWWKDQSFGYISGSASQGTVGITIISNQIGTLDDSSAFWNPTNYDTGNHFGTQAQAGSPVSSGNPYFNELAQLGGIFFRGQDNHIYQYDGYNLTRLSRMITPNITASSTQKANFWTQTSASDFGNGSGFKTFTDTTTIPGSVIPIGIVDNFSNNQNWTTTAGSSSFSINSVILSTKAVTDLTLPYGEAQIKFSTVTTGNYPSWFESSTVQFLECTHSLGRPCTFDNATMGLHTSTDDGYEANLDAGFNGSILAWSFSICRESKISDGKMCKNTLVQRFSSLPIDISTHTLGLGYKSSSGLLTLYFDGVSTLTVTNTAISSETIPFLNYETERSTSAAEDNQSCVFSNFNITSSTGTYYSSVNNAPNLNIWGTYVANDFTNGNSSITFSVRGSSNSFSVLSSTPSWIIQPNNATVNLSTNTFFQSKIDFYASASTETPTLNDFTFNWFEGQASDKSYISYFQDAIWFSVSSGSGTATNNTIFYLDLLNSSFLKDNIPANGFAVENNTLFIGDPLSSKVYRFGGVTSDNNSSIQSYWKSMDFTGTDPTVQNEFIQSDFSFLESSNTVTYTFDIDQSTNTTVFNIPTYSSKSSIIKRGFLLPVGKIGTYYNFSVGDNSSLPKWTFIGHRVEYNPLNWVPQTSG